MVCCVGLRFGGNVFFAVEGEDVFSCAIVGGRGKVEVRLRIRCAFDAEDGEHEIVEEIIRPVAILVRGQRFKNLRIFRNEIGREVHDEGDMCHLPSKISGGVHSVGIKIFAMVREVNPAFEIFVV